MCIIQFVSNYKQELIKKFDVLFTSSPLLTLFLKLTLFTIAIEENIIRTFLTVQHNIDIS